MVIGSIFSRSGMKCARPLGHGASVKLWHQILLMVVKFFRWSGLFVVSRVLVDTQHRRDPEKRGHVLDQTHEHDRAGGGLLVF